MRLPYICALTALLGLLAGSAAAQSPSVSIQFQNGFVTVNARNAPLRAILQEWARVGRTNIVNAERVTGSPITIELVNVPEQQALATLLRGITGYVVGARQVASTGPSSFDRIMIMPGNSAAVAVARPSNPQPAAQPPAITFVPGEPDDAGNGGDGRVLSAAQLQNQIREANARAAGANPPERRVEPAPPEEAARPGPPPTTPNTNRGNPFFTGGGGRAGEIAPVPQQPQRTPLRPNGDPEP